MKEPVVKLIYARGETHPLFQKLYFDFNGTDEREVYDTLFSIRYKFPCDEIILATLTVKDALTFSSMDGSI